jgi:hypothetical protein
MQKIINVVALFSGIVSAGVVGIGIHLYSNSGDYIESAKEKAIEEITSTLPKIIEGMIPELPEFPSTTGGVIPPAPSPSMTGPAIPMP